jgi:hypothetical protein
MNEGQSGWVAHLCPSRAERIKSVPNFAVRWSKGTAINLRRKRSEKDTVQLVGCPGLGQLAGRSLRAQSHTNTNAKAHGDDASADCNFTTAHGYSRTD